MSKMGLYELLKDNVKANEYYDTLHPSVKDRLRGQAGEISTIDDLYAFSNNAMTEMLERFDGMYQDGDIDPDE